MRYFAAILRIMLIAIWIRIMYLNNFEFGTIETCTWIALIIIAVYFAVIAKFGVQAVSCPTCKWDKCGVQK